MSLIPNKDNDETTIDDSRKHGLNPILNPILNPTVGQYKKIIEEDMYKNEEDMISTGESVSPLVSDNNNSTVSVSKVSMVDSPAASPAKVSMSCSVVKYQPPETFDPFKLKAYDEGLRNSKPKVIQFKRTLYSRDQETRDQDAIAKASKKFPRSTIELCD